jgi:hypothetical protein
MEVEKAVFSTSTTVCDILAGAVDIVDKEEQTGEDKSGGGDSLESWMDLTSDLMQQHATSATLR